MPGTPAGDPPIHKPTANAKAVPMLHASVDLFLTQFAEKNPAAANLLKTRHSVGQSAATPRHRVQALLAELEAQDHQAILELLAVANSDELPWLKLYTAKTEPTLSMQRLVDEAEAHERRTSRSTQRAYRPKK